MGEFIVGPAIANSEQLGGKTWVRHKRIVIIHLHKWTGPKSIKCMCSYGEWILLLEFIYSESVVPSGTDFISSWKQVLLLTRILPPHYTRQFLLLSHSELIGTLKRLCFRTIELVFWVSEEVAVTLHLLFINRGATLSISHTEGEGRTAVERCREIRRNESE